MKKNTEKTPKKRGGNPENVIPFKWPAGKSGNPNGRPKKFFTLMNEYGYKNSEITDCIRNMLGYTDTMLKDIFSNNEATVLERGVANFLHKFITTGRINELDTLFNRAFGAPKQTMDMDVKSAGKPIKTIIQFINPKNENE